jgi:hypothetical protein
MKYLAALLLAFVPCIAFADIKLNAPEEAEVGELIRLDASESRKHFSPVGEAATTLSLSRAQWTTSPCYSRIACM